MFAFVVRADMPRTVAMFANDLWLTLGLAEPQKDQYFFEPWYRARSDTGPTPAAPTGAGPKLRLST
jgi:hypothetical protein